MINFILYLLKVSCCTMLFYLCYILWLSRDTFYLRNRFALITMLLLSLLIPLFRLINPLTSDTPTTRLNPMTSIIYTGSSLGTSISGRITMFDTSHIIVWLYLSVTTAFLIRLVVSMIQTFMIIRKGKKVAGTFPKLIVTDHEHSPFSFFPCIVISRKTLENENYKEIIAHETAHVQQYHTFDLLFTEFIIVFLWFNPFIWLIRRSIVLNHEYMADNSSIRTTSSAKDYQYKLLNIRKDLINVPLAHNFSSLIKKRIIMINKKPTSNYAALKGILLLPAAAILFIMFSFRQESVQINQGQIFSKSSDAEILKFLAMNTGYPQEARNISDTGKIFVMIKIAKGGTIKECKAFTDRKDINVPLLPEIVILGYKSTEGHSTPGNTRTVLTKECLRVANTLSQANIPELKDKDSEFAVQYKFILK